MMNIVSRPKLEQYKRKHAGARNSLDAWYKIGRYASWNSPQDVMDELASVSILSGNRMVFNIGGNKYRLVVGIDYKRKQMFIEWFGTHAEYDKKKF